MPRKMCKHCQTRKMLRHRRCLCWRCYSDPAIRKLYAPSHKPFAHGKGTPPEPTTAAPGSKEKEAVMLARAKAGYDLHHPLDAKHGDQFCTPAWIDEEAANKS
jgi:hypothetical protein